MKAVIEILRNKPIHGVRAIEPKANVREAVHLMAEHNVGALLVMKGEKVVGIVSERDYVRRIAALDKDPDEVRVEEIMSSPVISVSPRHSNEECMSLMTKSRLRHLPVIDEGQLLGVVSIGDLVKDIISEQAFVIEQLNHYITAG